jgi:hypothetical protein
MAKQGKKSPMTLDGIPCEIRKEIFKYCVDWNGDYMSSGHPMPPLLIALQGHRPLSMYVEVLWLIYKKNTLYIELPPSTAKQFLPRTSVSRIEKLSVSFE